MSASTRRVRATSAARRARLLALATLLTLAAGACSGGGGGGERANEPAGNQPTATTGGSAGSGRCPAGSGLTGNVADHGAAAATGSTLQIEAGDSFFTPTCQTGVPAGTVTLTIRNSGQQLHNVSVPGQGVDKDVAAGQTITVKLKLDGKALPFFCKYHRTSGMVGSLLPKG